MKYSFRKKVLQVVRKIPHGKTLTYAQVARLAGQPAAYRAVGSILNKNYDPKIPCYRVIRSDRKPGGYNRHEGVVIYENRTSPPTHKRS